MAFQPSSEPAQYVSCRTLGHAWDDLAVPAGTRRPGGALPIWLRCTRCGTERHDLCNPFTFDVEGRQYDYPDDYRHGRGESLTRSEWRRTYAGLVGAVSPGQLRRARNQRNAQGAS